MNWNTNLRQCVIEVFWPTSTDKSKKHSSLLLTCKVQHVSIVYLVKLFFEPFSSCSFPSDWTVWCAGVDKFTLHSTVLTVSQDRHLVSFVNVPSNISCTHVSSCLVGGELPAADELEVPVLLLLAVLLILPWRSNFSFSLCFSPK